MDNFAEKKNAEGYSDPTPYQAIKNMVKPGEIWTFQKKRDNTEAEVLVVAFGDNIATILYLVDECKDGCVECVSKSLKWVNPRMLNWTWGGFLGKCVRKLDIKEFAAISVEIEKVLAVKISREAFVTVNPNEVDNLKAELNAMHHRCVELDSKAAKYFESYKLEKNEAEKMKVQLDTIKEMYSDLMEKFLQRA